MSRSFVISYRKCLGPVGGGRGVNYKLYLANKRYHLINNCYHIFSDMVIEPGDTEVTYSKESNALPNKSGLRNILSRTSIGWIVKHKMYRNRIQTYFKQLDNKYHFSADDVYVFHDVESLNEFYQLWSTYKNTILVYHQQGSLYNEWKSFNERDLESYRVYLNRYAENAFKNCCVLAFPSNGAKESLIASEQSFSKTLNKRKTVVVYNGFTKPEETPCSDEMKTVLERLSIFQGYRFATVSALNEAKAVERIPFYLADLKKYTPFIWVIVGTGVMSSKLRGEIIDLGLTDNVIWIDHAVPHDDILNLFINTDLYILFHKYSIFDYSTIEAMAYGNIPILTPVGGNKEVVFDNPQNGILVESIEDTKQLRNFLNGVTMEDIKNRNRDLQDKWFSELSFLQGYKNIIEQV